jgi:importin subunit alpha-2
MNLYYVGINSGEENMEMTATYAVRQFLSRYPSSDTMGYSHIDIFINANVVPKLVEFLSRVKKYFVSLYNLVSNPFII